MEATARRDRWTELDDDQLASRAAHDFDAFATLYRRYLCVVYRFVRSQTPDDATAEDLTAHIFFKALSSAGSYRGEGTYRAWLFRIAHNTISSYRSTRKRSAVTVRDLPEEADPAPCPATTALVQDARDVVWRTVSELPPTQREVVALHYLDDLSIAEVASITGRTRGAVRILLHRAREKLRGTLAKEGVV